MSSDWHVRNNSDPKTLPTHAPLAFCRAGGYQHQVDDVQAVIEWLRVEHGLRVVALIGHSMGGNVVLLHAAQHHVVPLVVNLSGRHHLERGIIQPSKAADVTEFDGPDGAFTLRRKGKAFRITKVSIAERLRTSMRVCVDIAASTRVLTVHGDADEVCTSTLHAETCSHPLLVHVICSLFFWGCFD